MSFTKNLETFVQDFAKVIEEFLTVLTIYLPFLPW